MGSPPLATSLQNMRFVFILWTGREERSWAAWWADATLGPSAIPLRMRSPSSGPLRCVSFSLTDPSEPTLFSGSLPLLSRERESERPHVNSLMLQVSLLTLHHPLTEYCREAEPERGTTVFLFVSSPEFTNFPITSVPSFFLPFFPSQKDGSIRCPWSHLGRQPTNQPTQRRPFHLCGEEEGHNERSGLARPFAAAAA